MKYEELAAELRAYREFSEGSTGADWAEVDVCTRAADAIEALAAENARLAASEPVCAAVKPLVWAPIETAPRGGEWFIARTERGTARVVHYADEHDRFPISHDGAIWETPPVEWIPLSRILGAITLRTEAEVSAEAWAAALEAAISATESAPVPDIPDEYRQTMLICDAIRALITDDASAALDRIKAEARAEGMREAACLKYDPKYGNDWLGMSAAILAAIPEGAK